MSIEQIIADATAAIRELTAAIRAVENNGEGSEMGEAQAPAKGKRGRPSKPSTDSTPSGSLFDTGAPASSDNSTPPASNAQAAQAAQGAGETATNLSGPTATATNASGPNAQVAATSQVSKEEFFAAFLALSELNANGVNGMQFVKDLLTKYKVKRAGELSPAAMQEAHKEVVAATEKANAASSNSLI